MFVGLENYEFLWDDSVFWLAVFNTLLYTVRRLSVLKFALGLWLALLLNENLPFKTFFRADRAAALGRADGAVGDRLLVDLRRAVLDHLLGADEAGADRQLRSTSSASHGTRARR